MSGKPETGTKESARPAILAGQFAAFLKASFIYPARNQRVTTSAELFLETLLALSDDERWMTIRFRSGALIVDQDEVEDPGPLTDWMLDTFTKASICGLEVGPGIDVETLSDFTETLRVCMRDRAVVFETEWGDRRGLRPVDLLFTGGHLEASESGDFDGDGSLRDGGKNTTGYVNPFSEGSAQANLLQAMAGDNQLSSRLEEMQSKLNGQLVNSRDVTRVDILGEIIRHLPTEALVSPQLANQVMDRVIEMTETEVLEAFQDGDLDADAGLSSLFLGIARKFFGTTAEIEVESVDAESLPVGRPGDSAYTPDLGSLLGELEKLPSDETIDIEHADPNFDAEMLGVYLHTWGSLEDDDAITRLECQIEILLESPSTEVISVLDAHTNKSVEPDARHKVAAGRLVELLKRTGRAHHLSRCDQLNTDVIKFGFPDNFLLFLDSLDESKVARDKLSDVCYGLTHERVMQEKEHLLEGEGILEWSRLNLLLSLRSNEVLPFVSLLSAVGSNSILPKLTHFLRSLEVPDAEGAALRALEDNRLTLNYVRDLSECVMNGVGNKKLKEYSLYLITQFIEEKAEDDEYHDRRVYAICALRFFPGEGTRQYLSDLATSGRLLKRSKNAKATREAAAKTLSRLGLKNA